MDPPDRRTAADDPKPGVEPDGDAAQGLTPGATAFLGLGLSIGLSLAILVGGGVALDGWLHWAPYGLLVGLALGVVMAVLLVVAAVRKYL
jgi:F0F1-type ATP synthase assembly protein I